MQAASANMRRRSFVAAIETEMYGKCPKPPDDGGSLADMIGQFVRTRGDHVVVRELDRWNEAEIKYALKVCKALGFTPTWTR